MTKRVNAKKGFAAASGSGRVPNWLWFDENEGFCDKKFDRVPNRALVSIRRRVFELFWPLIINNEGEATSAPCSKPYCDIPALKGSPYCAQHRLEQALADFENAGMKYLESRSAKPPQIERDHYRELWEAQLRLRAMVYKERRRSPWSDERATEWISRTTQALDDIREYTVSRLKYWDGRVQKTKRGNDPDRQALYKAVLRVAVEAGIPLKTSLPGRRGGGNLIILLSYVLNPILRAVGEEPLSQGGILSIIRRAKEKAERAEKAKQRRKWRAAGT